MIVALLDACVLFPAALRDLFMRLSVAFVFQPKWTERIHAEWIRSVLAQRPDLAREPLERTRELMDFWARDCYIRGYEARIPAVTLPDEDDRHILAAAITGNVGTIVTYNLSDFPESALAPHGIRAMHPDSFLLELLDTAPAAFISGIRDHRASLKNPSKTVDEYLATLLKHRLPRTVARLQDFTDVI